MRVEAVNRLRLRDVLVLRVTTPDAESEATLASFATEMASHVRLPVFIIDASMSLESLDEAEMRAAGWVRSNGANGSRS